MKINREHLLKNFEEFVNAGSGIVIGHPGVGKTILLQEYTKKLREENIPCLYLPIDKLGIDNELELKEFLKSKTDFVSYLRSNKGNYQGKGILVIDSFDAARSEKAQKFFLRLIWQVIDKLEESWNVVVSVRTYDAKKSEKLHALFSKNSIVVSNEYQTPEIPCRHFYLPPLSEEELKIVIPTVSGLSPVYEVASTELKELLKIPFNIWLMEKILSVNTNVEQISSINSEVQLLGLFWQNRVRNGEHRMDKENILTKMTKNMVINKTLSVKKSDIYETGEQPAWDEMFSADVINENMSSFQRVSFHHNILFDYAVSILLIEDEPQKVEDFILEDPARPVFLRPSLDYYFTRLWHDEPKVFWKVFWHILPNNDPNLRLFSRLIPTGTIVKELRSIEELTPLLSALQKNQENVHKAVLYLLQALRTLGIRDKELWTLVIRKISDYIDDIFVWDLTLVTNTLYDFGKAEEIELIIKTSGETSRNLFNWMWRFRSNASIDRLGSAWITPLVAKTFGTDPQTSKEILTKVLNLVNEEGFSIQFLYRLTHEIDSIWPYDPDFTRTIYETIFSYKEISEEKTGFGTPVLPMTSTRRQDYQMCQYELAQKFPKFLDASSFIAVKTAILCINSFVIEKHLIRYLKEGISLKESFEKFNFLGKETLYLGDLSYIWDLRDHDDEPIKMARDLFNYIEKLAKEENIIELNRLLEIFRDNVQVAFFWRRLLQTATKYPKTFTPILIDLCIAVPVLKNAETSYEAGVFIKSSVKNFSSTQIKLIETAIVDLPKGEKDVKRKNYLEDVRNRLLIQIPYELLMTKEAKDVIDKMPNKDNVKNEPPATFTTGSWDGEIFAEKIELTNKREEKKIKGYIDLLSKFSSANMNSIPTIESVQEYLPIAKKLYESSNTIENKENLRTIWRTLGEATGKMSRTINKLRPKEFAVIRDFLLRCADSEFPEPRPEYDDKYDSAGWSPDPRTEAAQGLPWLAIKNPEVKIINAMGKLINDPVPAVRFLIVREIFRVYESDSKFFWRISEEIAIKENNIVVLNSLLHSLAKIIGKNDNKSILVLKRLKKKAIKKDLKASEFVESFISLTVWLGIVHENKWAITVMNSILKKPLDYSSQLSRLTLELVSYFTPKQLTARPQVFERAIDWSKKSIDAVNKEFSLLPPLKNDDEKMQEKIRNLYHVIDSIVTRIYFAADVNKNVRDGVEISDQERKDFYFKIKPLLEYLVSYSSTKKQGVILAPTAHHFIELLNGVLKYDPKGALHLATQVVVASKPYGYNVDTLAITEIVNMVESILANFRNEVQEGQALTDLLNLLDVFSEAGWPQALQLVWRLDDIFR